MRVLLAPDCFGDTATAVGAATALAEGWRRARPADHLVLLPLSDGGPGFVQVLRAALPSATIISASVEDPLARMIVAQLLLHDGTAYVESAQACGLHLLTPGERDPGRTTTYGVGQLVRAAVEAGAHRVVVGLGGSATNDGGAGLLAALGVARQDAAGSALPPGGLALAGAVRLVGRPLSGFELVAATDVDAPLLGTTGASAIFGPQKGADPEQVARLDAALTTWADLLEAHLGVSVRDLPGAGAAGGLGAALLALGAVREPGIALVAGLVGLADRVGEVDLVVTGEGRFDWSSLRGKVVSGVAGAAAAQAVPCVVVAGQVAVGRREAAALGVDATYALADQVGLKRALADPHGSISAVSARVAEQWSPR